ARRIADVGIDEAGTEYGDADVGVGELVAQRLHHADDGKLRGGIHARAAMSDDPGDRGCGDDLSALAVRLNPRQEGMDSVEHAGDVDSHAPVPVIVRRLAQAAEYSDTGIVDDDVHLAEDTLALPSGLLHGRPVRHIERDCMDPIAGARELFERLIEMLLRPVSDDDLHPGISESTLD